MKKAGTRMFDPKTKILVVDEMPTLRTLVSKACKEMGFTDIIEVGDGALAWEKINESEPPFGLVISDWNLPNCTGIDLLKRIRNDSRFGKTPFILITAEAEEQRIVEAAKAGVSQYLVKPFNATLLREKLEAVHKKITG